MRSPSWANNESKLVFIEYLLYFKYSDPDCTYITLFNAHNNHKVMEEYFSNFTNQVAEV